ncbi:MAG: hypothetical protein HRT89_09685, partial [Lentisphaeria bacterium]|nr:hypothetical protein [Lentisphaeria bacterium]NQZ68331.1 hypothetical protein [Lentisphaeria bacterium]
KSGFFWEYLEESNENISVSKERLPPCQMPRRKDRGYLFRILYFKKRIAVEFSHIITDGTGAMEFLKALLYEYLVLVGHDIDWPDVLKKEGEPAEEEYEDAYKRYFKDGLPSPEHLENAHRLNFPFLAPGEYHVMTGIIPVKDILKLSKEAGVSLTEFITAIYIKALIEQMNDRQVKKRPVRILVPVNLRNMFPSKSMRNFFLPVLPEIDPRLGDYSFDEICKQVYHFMRSHVDDKQISKQMTRNVSSERHSLIKRMPLLIKQLCYPMIYNYHSSNQHSGVFSNMGAIRIPETVESHVDRFEFILNPNPATKTNLSAISFGENLYLTFSSQIANEELQRKFYKQLRDFGLKLKIESST